MVKRIAKGEHVQRVASIAQLSDYVPTDVSAILQRGQGKTYKRRAAVHREQVWLALHFPDELPNNRGACLEFPVHRMPDLSGTRCYLSVEGIRDSIQRRRKALI